MAELPHSFLPFQWHGTMWVSFPVSVTNPETQALWLWNSHCGCVSSRSWPSRTREREMHRAVWRGFYHPAVLLWTAAKIGDRLKQEEKSNWSGNGCERKVFCLIIESRLTEGQSRRSSAENRRSCCFYAFADWQRCATLSSSPNHTVNCCICRKPAGTLYWIMSNTFCVMYHSFDWYYTVYHFIFLLDYMFWHDWFGREEEIFIIHILWLFWLT